MILKICSKTFIPPLGNGGKYLKLMETIFFLLALAIPSVLFKMKGLIEVIGQKACLVLLLQAGCLISCKKQPVGLLMMRTIRRKFEELRCLNDFTISFEFVYYLTLFVKW